MSKDKKMYERTSKQNKKGKKKRKMTYHRPEPMACWSMTPFCIAWCTRTQYLFGLTFPFHLVQWNLFFMLLFFPCCMVNGWSHQSFSMWKVSTSSGYIWNKIFQDLLCSIRYVPIEGVECTSFNVKMAHRTFTRIQTSDSGSHNNPTESSLENSLL